jgi:hypothetical protein
VRVLGDDLQVDVLSEFHVPGVDAQHLEAGLIETVGTGAETVEPLLPVRSGSGYGRFSTRFFKKMKKSYKILKNTSKCVESNGVKHFQIFVCLV